MQFAAGAAGVIPGTRQAASRDGDAMDLSIEQLRARRTTKWAAHPPDVLPAWIADMDFACAPSIGASVEGLASRHEYGYASRGGLVQEAFATRMRERFGWVVDPGYVQLVSSLDQAICAAIMAFSDPGDAIAVQAPAYPAFMQAALRIGRRPLVSFMADNGTEWASSRVPQITSGMRMLILCNPHNPTGRAFRAGELEELAAFATRHDLIVLSDEVWADLVHPGRQHIPFASLGPEAAERTITITSAAKSFNIPALRCGVMHFGAPWLKERFLSRIPATLLGAPGVTGIDATLAAWQEGQPWLDALLGKLHRNRDWLVNEVETALPGVVFRQPQATFLAWLDCSALGLPIPAARFFLEHARVALSPGGDYGEPYEAFVRLNFATSRPILQRIIARLAASVPRRP